MYENFMLCDELRPSEACLVVRQYDRGAFNTRYHAHVPNVRLSQDRRINLLRALVLHFSGLGPDTIVRCYLNDRGRDPEADRRLRIIVSYPEPGVLRSYCGTDTQAWLDQVISTENFRQTV